MKTILRVIDEDWLNDEAGNRFFDRGYRYFIKKNVENLKVTNYKISATVSGSYKYDTEIELSEDGDILYDCTCPIGQGGSFCKHLVATGLAVLNEKSNGKDKQDEEEKALFDFLMSKGKKELAQLLITYGSEELRDSLKLDIMVATRDPQIAHIAIKHVKKLLNYEQLHPYHGSREYWHNVDLTLDYITRLFEQHNFDLTIKLCEKAINAIDEGLCHIDSSYGQHTVVESFVTLHIKACIKEKENPKKLAQRIYQYISEMECDFYIDQLSGYKELFGEEGLESFKALAEKQWKKCCESNHSKNSFEKYTLPKLMELLAEGVDEKIKVKAKNLAYAFNYCEIIALLRAEKRGDEALQWAEKGYDAFPENTDSRLLLVLAELYEKRGQIEESIKVVKQLFTESPSLENLKIVKNYSEKASCWSECCKWAIDLLLIKVKEEANNRFICASSNLLVETYIWLEKLGKAWKIANQYDCYDVTWLKLANIFAETKPKRTISTYKKQIDKVLVVTDKRNYYSANNLLKKLRTYMDKNEFKEYVDRILKVNYRRRSFVEIIKNSFKDLYS